MARTTLRICYDRDTDKLEVLFDERKGHFRETTSHHVMEKVDEQGNILGFSILKVNGIRCAPLEVTL